MVVSGQAFAASPRHANDIGLGSRAMGLGFEVAGRLSAGFFAARVVGAVAALGVLGGLVSGCGQASSPASAPGGEASGLEVVETPGGSTEAAPSTAVAATPVLGAVAGGEVNIYSARHYEADRLLYDLFTERTGISVNLIEASSDALIARVQAEGEFSPGDVLLTVDAGRLWRAEEAGILQPVESAVLSARIPAHLRHPEGLWFGVTKRARVMIYNAAAGAPEGLDSYSDLADPAFSGQVCMRSSSNVYNQSLLASQIGHVGSEAAEAWAQGVVANFARPPKGNDTAQIEEVGAGVCGVSMVNTYYVVRLRTSEDAAQRAKGEAVGVIFPDQDGAGTHVNVSGAAVLAHAPNRDNGVAFIEFLTSPEAQGLLLDRYNEYPVAVDASPAPWVAALGAFEEDTINASVLGTNQAEAVRIFDRAGWD